MENDTPRKKLLFDPNEDRSVYSCLGCNAGLFHASEKGETGVDFFIFNKPIDVSRLQFKKGADGGGEREMRCAICKRTIGRLLPSGRYRADAAVLNYAKAGAGERSADSPPGAPVSVAASLPQSNMRIQLIGAGIVGMVIGAAGALLIYNAIGTPQQNLSFTAPTATTTEEISVVASSSSSENRDTAVPDPPEILQSGEDATVGTQ